MDLNQCAPDSALLFAGVTALIALFALAVSIWTVRAAVIDRRLSVRPRLTGAIRLPLDSDFAWMEVSNQGLGPAVIRSVRFFVDRGVDESISASLIENDSGSWSAAINNMLLLEPFDPEFDRPNESDAYRPGECICLLRVKKRQERAAREILSAFARTSFELDYASMLGDKDSLQTVVVDGLEIVRGVVAEAELMEILAEDRARAAL